LAENVSVFYATLGYASLPYAILLDAMHLQSFKYVELKFFKCPSALKLNAIELKML
jgi:hypothetical protein